MKKLILLCCIIILFSLKINTQETSQEICCPNQLAAQLMVEKSMSKLVLPDKRKNILADIETTTEKYDSKCATESKRTGVPIEQICKPKSPKTSPKPKSTDLRLELRGMKIDDLYKAFKSRYNFYIDPNKNTETTGSKAFVIIDFSPKPKLPIRGIADQFINRVSGYIYIDLDNFNIAKVDGSIDRAFYFDYKLLGLISIRVDIYNFGFSVEYERFGDIMVEKILNGSADYEIKNRGVEKYTNKISNYRTRN